MFYEIMVSLATGGPALSNQRSKSSNFGIQLGTGTQAGDQNLRDIFKND